MFHFFVPSDNITDTTVTVTGADVNHIKNVLRMKIGEKFIANDGKGAGYCCAVREISDNAVTADILEGQFSGTELPVKLVLFQGLPKSDKFELIIQKCVELGVSEIVPVEMNRCVVRLDEKKKGNKLLRWQSISESAAKQSGRTVIPEIKNVMAFEDALEYSKSLDMLLVPYECADSVSKLKENLDKVKKGMSIGVFIGPEGGYEKNEINKAAEAGGEIVSLGKRILRTETAGIAAMSICMFNIETKLL